jgi:hypothetical protein
MSHTSAEKTGSTKPVKTSILDLPFEIREHILLNLLTSPIHANASKLPTIWFLPQYRTGQLHPKRLRMGKNKKLSQQFHALCLVSRQMRKDAINILFTHNLILLHITLLREPQGPDSLAAARDTYSPARFMGVNSPQYIKRLWGEEALLSIRNMGIWMGCGYKPGQGRLKEYLEDVVKTLKKSTCLQRLNVLWLNGYGVDCMSSFIHSRVQMLEIRSFKVERRQNGRRSQTDRMSNNLSIFATDAERILSPLKQLRRIRTVEVRGSVSDEWALYLEGCMKSEEETVPKFEGKMNPLANNKKAFDNELDYWLIDSRT